MYENIAQNRNNSDIYITTLQHSTHQSTKIGSNYVDISTFMKGKNMFNNEIRP